MENYPTPAACFKCLQTVDDCKGLQSYINIHEEQVESNSGI